MNIYLKNKANKKNKNLKSLHLRKTDEKIADVKLANDFFSRMRGLMLKGNIEYPLLFEIPQKINRKERSSIHSFFMRLEIVIAFIDDNDIVFEIADLKPWRYYVPKKGAKYIIEFDKKEFNDCLKIGDEIEIK